MASSRELMSQRKLELQTAQLTAPVLFSKSSWAVTLFALLQKGQLKDASSLGFCFLGGGLELLRLPIAAPAVLRAAPEWCLTVQLLLLKPVQAV